MKRNEMNQMNIPHVRVVVLDEFDALAHLLPELNVTIHTCCDYEVSLTRYDHVRDLRRMKVGEEV